MSCSFTQNNDCTVNQVRVSDSIYVLDRVNRRDRFSMKKPVRSSARGASFLTKHASNANVVRCQLDANSYLAFCTEIVPATSCAIYEYSDHCATPNQSSIIFLVTNTSWVILLMLLSNNNQPINDPTAREKSTLLNRKNEL
jgi:hypothetical protein